MLKGEGSTFGTSAETRGTVSQVMVKEEECSNLSLLSGVRKHTEEVMKNSPKQKESDLVSLPWGRFCSLRRGGVGVGGKEKWTKTEGDLVGLCLLVFFPFPSAMAFVEISKSRREKSDQKAWADSLVAENTVGTSP